MSNYLTIATVTEALRQVLDEAVKGPVPGASATAVRPTAGGGGNGIPQVGVNVYLYQVTTNGAAANSDVPTRREDGTLVQRPRAALDLHYLLTFYGNETKFETQQVLGLVLRTLHAQPVLTRKRIQSTRQSVQVLADSDLGSEAELVKFSPIPLSLEELSKLWSVFFQTAYTLSVAYQASVVFIEGKEIPQEPLPVRERKVFVLPLNQPTIENVLPQVAAPGSELTITGRNLKGQITRVSFGSAPVVPDKVADEQIMVTLPADLQAGVRTAQVIHLLSFDTSADPHQGFESNVVAFMLAPRITTPPPINVARGSTLTLGVEPAVARAQQVTLFVGDQAIAIPSRPLNGPPSTQALDFPIPADFPLGEFLLRIRVDGAQSPLDVDPGRKLFVGPKVTIA